MPTHYQYQGLHYELPDGLSNEEALNKIKKHLGQAPKEEGPSLFDRAQKAAGDFMTSPVGTALEVPVSLATGIGAQVAGGLRGLANLPDGMDAAANAVKETADKYTYQPKNKTNQFVMDELVNPAMALPGEITGHALEDMFGGSPAARTIGEAGMNAALSVAPFAKGVGRKPVAPQVDHIAPLREQAPVAPREPVQMELPLENSLQQAAEIRGQAQGQPDLFGPQNIPRTDIGPVIGPKPTEPPINTMAQHELFDQPEQGRVANPYEAVTGDWRVDENGMPVKADLSMDVANAENPLQRNLWGDELPAKHPQEAVPLTEAIDSMDWAHRRGAIKSELTGEVSPSGELLGAKVEAELRGNAPMSDRFGGGQRGNAPIINDLAKALLKLRGGKEESETLKNFPPVAKEPTPNSMATPTLPETIIKKQEVRQKLNAVEILKKIAPEYSSISTKEEAIHLAKDAKDIGHVPGVDNFRNAMISGINGMVFLKPSNPIFNFIRFTKQQWENRSTKFSKDFVTAKDGFATLGSKLSKQDMVTAHEVLMQARDAGINIGLDNIGKLKLKPEIEAYILSVRKMLNEMDALRGEAMLGTGRNPAPSVDGHIPSLWSGAYKGVIRDKAGKTLAIPQSDTLLGYKRAVASYLRDNPGATVINMPRKGLNSLQRGNNLFTGFNDILNVLAQNDPVFAKLQLSAQMKINEANHRLGGFDVHEIHKSGNGGVKGSLGDRAHVSPERNARDLFKGLIDYAEQGSQYYAMQKGLSDIGEVLTHPDTAHMTNTTRVAQQYLKHVTGQDLNPIGAALNWIIDAGPRALGVSSKVPLNAFREMKALMGLHLMGVYNPVFTALQLTQVVTGAMPEIIKVGSKLHQDVMSSAATASPIYSALRVADWAGKEGPKGIPEHMQKAYQYAKDAGIIDFSELEVARNAGRNRALAVAEKGAAHPISIGERMTRPPVFMTFADIFHKFGLPDEEAFMAAHHATNMSMGDYHPAERPQIYSQLGVVGEFGGALTTYKHNALTNMYIRGRDALVKDKEGNRMSAAAIAAVGAATFFQGLTGMPGFDELDLIHQWATGDGIRERALASVPEWGKSGVLSAATGLDFQSRASLGRILPELKGGTLSPQLAALGDIAHKAYMYGKFGDEQSKQDFLKAIAPAGLKGMVEDTIQTDPSGIVRNAAGEQMAPEARSENERLWRRYGAVRPLNESIEQKDVYIDSKKIKEREDEQKVLSQRFKQAFARGDQNGMDTLAQMYYDKEGDPQTLLNEATLMDQIVRSNQSQRERMTGKLQASIRSINRYRDMNDGR